MKRKLVILRRVKNKEEVKNMLEMDETLFDIVGNYIDKRLDDDKSISVFDLFEEGLQKLRDIGVDEKIIVFLWATAGMYSTDKLIDGISMGLNSICEEIPVEEWKGKLIKFYENDVRKRNFKILK